MAAFNSDQFIETSMRSVLDQTMEDFELLIINDGSVDDSEQIVLGYKDQRIKYYFQENKGVSAARNLGLEKMSGDYFCFLDADDFMPPRSLEYRYNKFQNREELEFVDGEINTFSRDLKTKINTWQPSYSGNPLSELLKISDSCFFGLTWMIRKRSNITYRFQENISHGEDLLFFIDISKHGGLYDFVDEDVLHYRKGHKSAMNDLKGLEEGYHQIYQALKVSKVTTLKQTSYFKRKARNIIFNSYLGNYQFINALQSIWRKW
jgi:glycosyltransferase involved in cell wall biosynthesis